MIPPKYSFISLTVHKVETTNFQSLSYQEIIYLNQIWHTSVSNSDSLLSQETQEEKKGGGKGIEGSKAGRPVFHEGSKCCLLLHII